MERSDFHKYTIYNPYAIPQIFNLQFGSGLFVVLGWIMYSVKWPVVQQAVPEDTITILGQELLGTYIVPFEIASVLLLAALVG